MMGAHGHCDTGFDLVGAAFERNFAERSEIGASVCVVVGGHTVVDLWGGLADPADGTPWRADTIGQVWSATKGALALCAAILVDRGDLDLARTVASYWPEFRVAGKETATVAMALTHRAGVPHVRRSVPPGGHCDWELMTAMVAQEEPFWPPGERQSYHALTFGWLVGELVRRIDGRSVGTFFADEVATPLGLDLWIGLPPGEHHRVAPNIAATPPPPSVTPSPFEIAVTTDPSSPAALILTNNGGFVAEPNQPMHWRAEIPAANGMTNARGLAGMYGALADAAAGPGGIVSPATVALIGATASTEEADGTLLTPMRFSLGFMKATANPLAVDEDAAVVAESAFGHVGMGGSFGFVDPSEHLSFGYTMNRQGTAVLMDGRGQSLVDAVYRSLGYESRRDATWRRASVS